MSMKFPSFALFLALLACNSDLAVMPGKRQGTASISVAKLDRLAARPGDQVIVSGDNLNANLKVFVNQREAVFTLVDASSGTFLLPVELDEGLLQVDFKLVDKSIAKIPLMNGNSIEDMPVVPVAAEAVCDNFILKNTSGELFRGLSACQATADACSSDGQSGCEASVDFPAVLKNELPEKLAAGKSLLGMQSQDICASDTNSTLQVTADLSGGPLGTTESNALKVEVGGSDVVQYKYKVRTSTEAPCSDPQGYSEAYTVDTPIATNVAAKPNGRLELCVLGMNADGQWQTTPSTTIWTKASPEPVAIFSGEPEGSTNGSSLNVDVSGFNLPAYKYKLRTATDSSCENLSGYSAEIPASTPIYQDLSGFADGRLELCVIGRDSQGVWQDSMLATSSSWTLDRTPPVPTLANPPQGTSGLNTLDVNVAGTGVTHYKYKIRDTADTPCADSLGYSAAIPASTPISDSVAGFADGLIELCIVGRDSAGNWQSEASANVVSWTRDTVPPIATLSGAPAGSNNASALTVTVAGTGVTHYKFKLRDASGSACSSSSGYSAELPIATALYSALGTLPDGPLELCVVGRDEAGNWQTESSATTAAWTKDQLPPLATLSGTPSGTSSLSSLNVTVGGSDVVQYRYKIRSAADAACSDISAYSGALPVSLPLTNSLASLADGSLQLCVLGQDSAGNWQLEGTASMASWIKDSLAPTATLANYPSGSSQLTTLNISVGGADASHYKYKLRAPADSACSVNASYSAEIPIATPITSSIASFADASIEVCVIARDSAGNWQALAASTTASWVKDSLAPTAALSGAPTGTSNASLLNVTVGGSDVSHYKYKIRIPSSTACSQATGYSAEVPVSTAITNNISALADGALELCVIGRDSAGNWQSEASAASAAWTKDLLSPIALISGEPTSPSSSQLLSITVSGTDLSHYKYKLREASDSACSDSTGYSAAVPVATPIADSLSALADGTLQLCVIGADSVGNWQLEGTATAVSWVKDTLPPTASIADAPSGTNNASLLNVTISGTDVSHYKYKLREAASTACSNSGGYSAERAVAAHISDSLSALADGNLEICVIGRDAAGNWQTEATATAANWTKDATAPTATISGAPSGTNNALALNATIAGSDVTHYKFKLREAATSACSSSSGYSAEIPVATLLTSDLTPLADGNLQLCVVGRDSLGNWQSESSATSVSWTKNTTGSSATLSGVPSGTSLVTSLNITVAGTDIVQYKYKLRESADSACSNSSGYSAALPVATPITNDLSALSDGILEVCVIGLDSVGTWQPEALATAASWTKDTTAPLAVLSNVPSLSSSLTTLAVTISGTDVTHYKYKIRAPADTACSNSAGYSAQTAVATAIADSISAIADGTIEICVIGKDTVGNWQAENAASTASWTKDTTAPTATISSAPTGTNSTLSLNVSIAGTDVTHYKYKIREAGDTACSNSAGYSSEAAVATAITANISALADGVLQLCVIGRDSLGNWQAEASAATASWTKDTLPPAATLSGVPTGSSLATGLNITVAGTDVLQYKYKLREAADTACSDSTGYSAATSVSTHITNSIAAFADGVIQVCVIGQDASGNWQLEGTATAASWTKDTAAPIATLDNAPTGTNNALSLAATVAGTDVTHYKYKIRETGDTACSNSSGYSAQTAVASPISNSISGLGDGIIELCVIGRDSAGNWQAEASATALSWTKDTTAPSATISNAPTGTNNTTSLNVTIAGAAVSHYKYKLREPADAACSDASGYSSEVAVATPITASLSALDDGVIQLCVIGRDASGNWQAESSAAAASWTKDALPSTATLSGAPTGNSQALVLDITVAGVDIASYRYKLRTTADPACSVSSGYSAEIAVATHITDSITALADGSLQLCVIGKDSVGNWQTEASASSASWTKDTLAPSAIISNAPSGTSGTTALNISISGSDVTHYKYKLRETATTACSDSSGYSASVAVSSPITDSITALAEGSTEVCVIGKDSAGNWQAEASATTASWIKDTLSPTATISGAPTGTVNSTALNVSIAGSSVTHYKYKLRVPADLSCADASGYSAETLVATSITDSVSALADGVIQLCVIGRDNTGNWQSPGGATATSWTKDTAAPIATLSGEPSGSSLLTSLDISVAGTDVVQYKYKIREAADAACSDSSGYSAATPVATHVTNSIAALADGTIQVCVIGRDSAGNWQAEASATSIAWTKDTSAPVADISNAPSSSSSTTSLNITIGGTGVSHYKYKIRASADTACSNSAGYSAQTAVATPISNSISGFADGTIEVCVIGRDSAGNWQTESTASTANWTKDTTAPTATISSAPTGTNSTLSLNVSIAGTDVTHYKYKMREAGDTACSNSAGYSSEAAVATAITANISALADGVLQLCVIGRDSLGNWQAEASAATASWTKDTLPPAATLAGVPTGSSLTTGLNITVAGTDVLQYKFKLREAADTACSDSTGYSAATSVSTHITNSIAAFADGVIQVCVIGQDASGNWQLEGTATAASWTKDTTGPIAIISDAPTGTNNALALAATISGTDVTHYKYKIRETGDTACSNSSGYSAQALVATALSASLAALADGSIELCVIGKDTAGNWQAEASATALSWTKDTTAPSATISSAPTGTNNTTSLNVTIAGAAVSHYKYKLREPADAACSDPSGYSSEAAVASPITASVSGLDDGVIQLCVIGRDASGNWQAEGSAATASWTKDALPPTATLSGAPTGSSLVTSPSITVAGTDVVQYKFKIRVPADSACSDNTDYSSAIAVATPITSSIAALADGTIQVCVIGQDSIGNWQLEAAATTASWTKDTQASTATVSGEPTGTNNAANLNVTVAGTDITEYKYKLRESATTACSNSTGYSSAVAVATPISSSLSGLADGAIELCVIGKDTAGNWQAEASATSVSWTKDSTPPTASIGSAPTGTNNLTSLAVTISGTGVTHYKYKLRESADLACSSATGYGAETAIASTISASFAALADGALQLCVIGRDSSGNWQSEASATTASWTKDTLPPAATLSGAPSGTSLTTSLDITVAGTDVTEYKYKIRAAADAACSDSSSYSAAIAVATHITSSISAMADGVIQVCVVGKDSSGNWQLEGTSTSASWTKDTTAPTATISSAPSGTNATVNLNVTVAGTDVSHYKYKIRASADSACSVSTGYSAEVAVATHITDDISAKADGTIELCVIGRDAAGNWKLESAASVTSWTKDTTPPTATITGAPSGTSATTSLDITIAGTGVTGYKYKIRSTTDTACSDPLGYLAQPNVALHITNSISSLAEGTIQLCVIGVDSSLNWQAEASATTVTWQKDATLPTAPTAFSVAPREISLQPSWTSGGGDVTGFLVLRRATTTISDAPTAGSTYSVGNTIGSSTVAYVGSASNFTDSSLTNGTKYFYRIFAYDLAKNYSSGLIAWGRPVSYEPPAADSLLLWTDTSYTDSFFLANDCATAVSAADQTVGCMKDLSSTRASLIQATSGNRPVYKTTAINGHQALRHTDSHWLRAASSNLPSGNQEHTVVFLGAFTNTTTSGAIHIGSSSNDSMIKMHGDSSQIIYAFGNNDLKYTAPSSLAAKLYFGTYNAIDGTAANRKFYINNIESSSVASTGTLTNTLSLPSNPAITLGSDNGLAQHLTGDSGEVLLYNKVLSSNERIELSRYAWNKWGIPQIEVTSTSLLSGITNTWTDGVGSASYLLVRRAGSAPTFAPVNGVGYSTGAQGSDTIVYASTAKTYTDTSIVQGTTYYYALYGNDGSNNYTPVVSTSATVLSTPTLNVGTNDAKLDLSWSAAAQASGYLVVRKTSSAPTFVPTNGTTYSTGAQGSDTIVYVGTGTSYQNTGLTNGTTYHYKLYAYDSANHYATATSASGTPVSPCVGGTTTYTSNGSTTVPAGCNVSIEVWGAGGGGGTSTSGQWSGAGGKGGKVIWDNVAASVTVNTGDTIAWVIGQPGLCGATGTGGNGSADAVSTTNGKGGNGGNAAAGAVGVGVGATGGNGGSAISGGYNGGNGYYGGGGGGAGAGGRGGGGGGATAVKVSGTLRAIAGGGAGGGGAGSAAVGTNGGGGCGGSGGMSTTGGAGGGGGDCLGTSETVSGGANGGGLNNGATCTNTGTAGKVIVTFGP